MVSEKGTSPRRVLADAAPRSANPQTVLRTFFGRPTRTPGRFVTARIQNCPTPSQPSLGGDGGGDGGGGGDGDGGDGGGGGGDGDGEGDGDGKR